MEHLRTRLDPIRRGGAIAALAAAGGLVGCGGDSGGSSVIIDEQITFSVSGSLSVLEETLESAAVTTASANGVPVTVRIQNAGDGAAFAVEDGEIVPRDRLDFEAPADENADNVYAVTLVAEASGLTSITRQIQVTVRNDPADDIIKLTTGREDDFFASDAAFFGDGEVVLTVSGDSSCNPNPLAASWALIVDPVALPGASDRELLVADLPGNAMTKLVSPSSLDAPCRGLRLGVASGRYRQGSATTEVLSVGHLLGPPFAGPGTSLTERAAVFADSVSAAGPDVELDGLPVPGVLQTTFENMSVRGEIDPREFADLDNDGLDEAFDTGIDGDGVGGLQFEIRIVDGRQVRFDVVSFLDLAVGDPGRTDVVFGGDNRAQTPLTMAGPDFNGDGGLDVIASVDGSATKLASDTGTSSLVILFGDEMIALPPGEVDFASLTRAERAVVEATGLIDRTAPIERARLAFTGTEDLSGDGVPELLFFIDQSSIGPAAADIPLSDRRSLFILDGAALKDAPDRVLRGALGDLPLARLEFDAFDDASFPGFMGVRIANLLGDLTGDGEAEILVVTGGEQRLVVSGGAINPVPGAVTLQSELQGAIVSLSSDQGVGGAQAVPDRLDPLSDEWLVLAGISEQESGSMASSSPAYIIPALRVRQAMEQGGEINLSDIGE